jgi:hypothetical protein
MTWDGQMHRCDLCRPSGPRCGHKNPGGRMNECTRAAGHTGSHALCGWLPNTHNLEQWEVEKQVAKTGR